jgi:hypothetical protein
MSKDIDTLEGAKALVAQEKQERAKRCQARLDALLKEERCTMQLQVSLRGLTLTPHLTLIVLD